MVDYVKKYMEKNDIPLTRESYIKLNWPGVDPKKPLPAELEAELPEEFQNRN